MKTLIKLLVFLLLSQSIFTFGDEREIAILVKRDFPGELSFAHRIQAACKNLHWKADIVDISRAKRIRKYPYDFVINLVPGPYKNRNCKTYLAIFHPLHHYFKKDGSLKKMYDHCDGYLLTYFPEAHDKNFHCSKRPFIKWYPTVQTRAYQKVDPKYLFHLCCNWGNRFHDPKMKRLLHLLDQEPFTRFYGNSSIQPLYPRNYQSDIPFDSDSVCETASHAGVTLVLHSDDHNTHGLPSGRVFEAAAASTVIICDRNAFVKEHFGDSVLYINTDESAESIHNQIKQAMNWIQSNGEAAMEKAKRAHEIYKNHFLLEDQLLCLSQFHDQLSRSIFSRWMIKISDAFRMSIKKISALFFGWVAIANALPNPIPLTILPNIDSQYSLINSVDFHPQKNLFCATYTHNNKILFYEIDKTHRHHMVQAFHNPSAKLSEPQHAVFSPDGKKLVIANWTNQTLNVYLQGENGLFREVPAEITPPPKPLQRCKPHGIAFSPCGKYLAVAYGAANYFEKGIALFHMQDTHLECVSLLKNPLGTPKGIAFSPDGTHLLVTFCDLNGLAIFPIQNQNIDPIFKQMIQGKDTEMYRPEDVKISPDGRYCAVTNSEQHTVTFYHFDQKSNSLPQATPCYTFCNPESQLSFPHGIAFSADGAYLAITQFGPIQISEQGDIFWNSTMKSSEAKVNLYLTHFERSDN